MTEQIAPVRVIARDADGRHIVDFGQNLPGWLRIAVDGPAGHLVRIRHAEVLAADGSLYTDNLRTARQTDEFIAAAGRQVLRAAFHRPRLPVRRDLRVSRRARPGRRGGPGRAFRHPGRRVVRVIRSPG